MGQPVGERRPVVEDVLGLGGVLGHRRLEGMVDCQKSRISSSIEG